MAAYAALVSLTTTLNNIQIHPQVSTFFDHQQLQSLHQIINFLLHFVESINSRGGSGEEVVLERRIASTAHAAEGVIESHVVEKIISDARHKEQKRKLEASNLIGRFKIQLINCARPTTYITDCLLDLYKEVEEMNTVKETVMEFLGTMEFKDEQSSHSIATSSKPTTTKKIFMVGFDEKLIQIMDRLTAHQPRLQIVPIVGMGGIGKTTLATSVYDNLLIVESFDIRAWVTISQEYSVKYVLHQLLSCIGIYELESEEHQLGLKLYQTLSGRRYLIVLDDMWSTEAWDKIKFYFPDNDNKSRVVITTRIWSVATTFSSSSFEMDFLDEDQSWKLFCGNVFPEKRCPPELEEVGKKIVRECRGLPLSIVVIGGLLRNSRSTSEYWENFARDISSILMSGNDEHCFKILSLSYNHLPAHLKPCFLYMGVFREDEKIHVSHLIKLLVDGGFLKQKEGQTLEEIAEDYINDLIDRNLILVGDWKWNGRIKHFKMHDLVREVCLKIGKTDKIFHWITIDISTGNNMECHLVCDGTIPRTRNWPKVFYARTFLYSDWSPLPFKVRMLRVLTQVEFESLQDISQHVNLRYLYWRTEKENIYCKLPSSISLLWNVHTLIYSGSFTQTEGPSEIWYMRQLRHLQFVRLSIPDPQQDDSVLLPNLHTLSTVVNFSFTEEVCKRIPNIKKLGIACDSYGEEYQKKCCYYLEHLHKLQSLYCFRLVPESLQSLVFPSSLRKLSLDRCGLHWGGLNTFGLSLPHLQVLKLYGNAVVGPEWDCVEGAFPCLKFLHMEHLDLTKWIAESSEFFPVLEKLHLERLSELEKIPSGIGEIQTLESLLVDYCSLSAAISSVKIVEEQLSLGFEDLQLELNLSYGSDEEEKFKILEFRKKVESKNFTSKNFKFDYWFSSTI